MIYLKCDSLGEAWTAAMRIVMDNGENIYDDDVQLKEVRNLYITINNIREDDPVIQTYADPDRVALMKRKYATCGLVGDYKVDYGSYIYNNNGVDQIEWVINRIRNKPETKSATITLHRPGEDLLACLSLLDFKYRNSFLDLTVVYRSQNIYWSHPGNMIALRSIQQDVANALGYNVGKIELLVVSAHIYKRDYEKVVDILKSMELLH